MTSEERLDGEEKQLILQGLFSSVVERWSRKPKAVSSILTGSTELLLICQINISSKVATDQTNDLRNGSQPFRCYVEQFFRIKFPFAQATTATMRTKTAKKS